MYACHSHPSFACPPIGRGACCSRSAVTRALHSPQCHPRPIPVQVAIGSAVPFGISCADWRNSDIPAVDVQSRYIDCEDVQVCELACNGLVLPRERHNIARGQVSIKPGRAPIVYLVTARLPFVHIHLLQHPGFLPLRASRKSELQLPQHSDVSVRQHDLPYSTSDEHTALLSKPDTATFTKRQ
jgi:hypothetical protein